MSISLPGSGALRHRWACGGPRDDPRVCPSSGLSTVGLQEWRARLQAGHPVIQYLPGPRGLGTPGFGEVGAFPEPTLRRREPALEVGLTRSGQPTTLELSCRFAPGAPHRPR